MLGMKCSQFFFLPCFVLAFNFPPFLGPQHCSLRAPIQLPSLKTPSSQEPTFCEQMGSRDGRRGQGVEGQSPPSQSSHLNQSGEAGCWGQDKVYGRDTSVGMELHLGLVRSGVHSVLEALLKRRNTELPGPLQGFWKKLLQVRSSQLKLHQFPGVLVIVLQRNRTNIIYIYMCVCVCIYYTHIYNFF